MGIFDNIVSLKLGDLYNEEEGLEAIRDEIKSSSYVEFLNVPNFFVEKLEDLLPGKKTLFFSEDDSERIAEYEEHYQANNVKIRVTHFGRHAKMAIIGFKSKISFYLTYNGDTVYDISSMRIVKCLRCMQKNNTHFKKGSASDTNVFFGDIYEVQEGLEVIREKIRTSERIIINNIPDFLLEELIAIVPKKENVKILASSKTSLREELAEFPKTHILPHIIKTSVFYHGLESRPGGMVLDGTYFGVSWDDDEILDIRTIEWAECANCMYKLYNTEWVVSRKFR